MTAASAQSSLVRVAFPASGNEPLTYRAPASFRANDLTGRRVLAPLGGRTRVGVVVEVVSDPRAAQDIPASKLRSIETVLDTDRPSLPPDLLRLCEHVVQRYLCRWPEVIHAALPGELLDPPQLLVRWVGPELEGQWPKAVQYNRRHLPVARYLAGKEKLSASALRRRFPHHPVDSILFELETHQLIVRQERLADLEDTATIEVIHLASGATLDAIPERATARRRLFNALVHAGGEAAWTALRETANVSRSVLNDLVSAKLVRIEQRTREVIGLGFDPRATDATPPPLTAEQTSAVATVTNSLESNERSVYLLDGLPGTGKTRVYIELIAKTRALGKGVLVLVPEISLTPQVVARIRQRLDEPVVVMHSALSRGQRLAAWRALHLGEANIVVGPRSAVFAPVLNLGLVIVDEEHEEAYKQQDPTPRYHGRDLAAVRGWLANVPVVLASATPSLETMHLVLERKRATRLELTQRFGSPWPEIRIVDRRRETGDAPYVGPELAAAIRSHASAGDGIILMITRRGYSPVMQCHECGDAPGCPNCDLPLTYHATGPRSGEPALRCHLCGYSRRVPERCDNCQSNDLRALGMGTQRIEAEILDRFPELLPLRMDRDTLRRAGEQERILRAFNEGESQVLLGTQLVAKGHDFGHVTLVGVINADPSLNQPDFRAVERTFRLLIQAAGRAGRGDRAGEVIIQTLRPEHAMFDYLRKPSRDAFIEMELQRRKLLGYPPSGHMILLTFLGSDDPRTKHTALRSGEFLRHHPAAPEILGPEPAVVARVKRKYRWRLVLKSSRSVDPNGELMRRVVRQMMNSVKLEPGVRLNVDVDPTEVV